MEQDESDVLAKAAQLAALEKRIGFKLDMAEYIEPDEYDGEEIDEANTLALAYAGRISNALLAKHSALEQCTMHLIALVNICRDLNVHVDIGEDMNSEELARMYKLKSAETFLALRRAAALSTKLEAQQ